MYMYKIICTVPVIVVCDCFIRVFSSRYQREVCSCWLWHTPTAVAINFAISQLLRLRFSPLRSSADILTDSCSAVILVTSPISCPVLSRLLCVEAVVAAPRRLLLFHVYLSQFVRASSAIVV